MTVLKRSRVNLLQNKEDLYFVVVYFDFDLF